MSRDKELNEIAQQDQIWDVVIIGGGASGLGAAIDSVTRGFKTLLLEQYDFSKGTSSRSTKLVHGGVRYLAQGNVALVLEALRERGLLKKNAPHLVKDQRFIIPAYQWWERPFYTIGLTLYDLLAGKLGLGRSFPYAKKKTLDRIPTLVHEQLRGGVVYHDGQFDDSRLAVNMVQTVQDHGGTILNYMKVVKLLKNDGKIAGVVSVDQETGKEYTIQSKTVLNATGVFVDDILRMDDPSAKDIVRPSQGVHLVLDKEFVPGDHAIMIPKTSDGRVLFAIPWHDKVVVGTTDIQKEKAELEPMALEEEVDFILETVGRFLKKAPTRADVKSVFAGLRPLAAPTGDNKKTKEISRGHRIVVSESNLVTIIGGKWTTYRQMAEDSVDKLIEVGKLPQRKAVTRSLPIHGSKEINGNQGPLSLYGTDEDAVMKLVRENPELGESLGTGMKIIKAQVVWAVREEMARTVEDFLARRTRALLLDARESIAMAAEVAGIMARELGRDQLWEADQVASYSKLAKSYLLN
ncbi:glycerol-3-phosphate dehydrogenase/oxidase [Gaoshiqia sp. Z1-71]|uniref:glycerol-3-phosphate dehydrogenase/oxidase n=1 Tax=Gaoshiqia hydrogeniformans TaxID=3290090 RepID=UPI003BF850C1